LRLLVGSRHCHADSNVFEPPRSLEAIDTELKTVTDRILKLIAGLST
jgi:hypothetical protein